MFIVIGLMLLGVLTGRLLRKRKISNIHAVIMIFIWMLLFLLGLEVGSNPEIIHNLHTLGTEALLVAVFAVLGSSVGAFLLWLRIQTTNRKGDQS